MVEDMVERDFRNPSSLSCFCVFSSSAEKKKAESFSSKGFEMDRAETTSYIYLVSADGWKTGSVWVEIAV